MYVNTVAKASGTTSHLKNTYSRGMELKQFVAVTHRAAKENQVDRENQVAKEAQ